MVPDDAAIAEPRLLGDWRLVEGNDTSFIQVTQMTSPTGPLATVYAVRTINGSDTLRFEGRIGPLGRDTWVFEAAPADSPLQDRYAGWILPAYMQVVVYRTPTELEFAYFNTDSIEAALTSNRLRTPYMLPKRYSDRNLGFDDIFLTGEPAALRAALVSFASRPGALVPVAKVGHQLTIPKVDFH